MQILPAGQTANYPSKCNAIQLLVVDSLAQGKGGLDCTNLFWPPELEISSIFLIRVLTLTQSE